MLAKAKKWLTDCDITHSFHPTRRGSCQRVVCQNLSLSEGFLTIFFLQSQFGICTKVVVVRPVAPYVDKVLAVFPNVLSRLPPHRLNNTTERLLIEVHTLYRACGSNAIISFQLCNCSYYPESLALVICLWCYERIWTWFFCMSTV